MDAIEKSRNYNDSLMSYWLFLPNGKLTQYLDDCLALTAHVCNGYIWQNDSFCLKFSEGSEEIGFPHLYGTTDYGENVGDLWFITYILRRLTLEINGLAVKVQDSDGEFLLIEAADHLPKWVTPDSVKNRVYIYKGELHIIPLASSPANITSLAAGVPTIGAAIDCIRTNSEVTRASPPIQNSINKRLGRYPEQAFKDIHSTTCFLPLAAANLLSADPQLISLATRAFYLRDPIDLKSCQNMRHFPPDNRVNVKVKLTRCLYAQLVQQKFFPPKRSAWNIPSATNPRHKACDLGMKIAFGFEMICANSSADADDSTESVDESKWARYLSSLHKFNYFQGEIEGSVKYTQLYDQARRYFISNQESLNSANRCREEIGAGLLRQIKASKFTEEQLREAEAHLTPDDDDSWLYMTYAELDQMLEDYSGSAKDIPDFDKKPGADFDPTQLTDSMSAFINKQSNILSGAELPTSEELKFDSKGFLAAIEQMMNGENEGALDSDDSSLDEYESDDSLSERAADSHRTSSGKGSAKVAKVAAPKQRNVSFHSTTGSKSTKSNNKDKQQDPEPKIEDFMEMMDRELSRTHVGKTFERQTASKSSAAAEPSSAQQKSASTKPRATLAEEEDISDSEDDLEPVDVDLNTVKNLLESYNHQMGLPGPTSNLLESMGLKLPQNADE